MNGCLGVVRSALILLIGGSFVVALVLMFWFTGHPPTPATPAQADDRPIDKAQLRAQIHDEVFVAYDKAQYPKLSAKLEERWDLIQPLREAAAYKAITGKGCKYVDISEASVDRSSKQNIRIFVYCDDSLSRIDFNEEDLIP